MIGMLRPVTMVTIGAAFAFGVNLALLGCLKLWLSRGLNLREGRVGTLLKVHNVAWIPWMLASGYAVDSIGVQAVVILASLAMAVALFALSFKPGTAGAFACILLSSLGSAGLCISSLVLMPEAFFPGQSAASFNTGLVFVSLGALITPGLIDLLIRLIGFRRGLALFALLFFIPASLAVFAGKDDLGVAVAKSEEVPNLPADMSIWLGCLVLALYTPVEASISAWAARYLSGNGPTDRRAFRALAQFWGAFLLSRLFTAALIYTGYVRPSWETALLVVPALLAAVVLGNMAGSVSPERTRIGWLLLGLCLGPILPTLIGMLFDQLSLSEGQGYGLAFGWLFAVGSLGGLLFSPLIGVATRRESPQAALRIPMIAALLLCAAALVFGLSTQQRSTLAGARVECRTPAARHFFAMRAYCARISGVAG